MNERTPTTKDVQAAYLYGCHRHRKGGLIAEFDRWLEQVKAEAWDEGHHAGQHNEHEHRPGRAMTNPYRKDKTNE